MSSSSHRHSEWVSPVWQELAPQLEPSLDHWVVDYTMKFAAPEVIEKELEYISHHRHRGLVSDRMTEIAEEAGPTGTHHLYSFLVWLNESGWVYSSIHPKSVIEWGPGYGGFARQFVEAFPGVHYTLIDLPQPLELQKTFLKDYDNFDYVSIEDVNPDMKAEIFVSTWALSESTIPAQRWVEHTGFFSCKSFLLAYQVNKPDFEAETRNFDRLARKYGTVFPTAVPGNLYSVR
jgi:hypothetical protein